AKGSSAFTERKGDCAGALVEPGPELAHALPENSSAPLCRQHVPGDCGPPGLRRTDRPPRDWQATQGAHEVTPGPIATQSARPDDSTGELTGELAASCREIADRAIADWQAGVPADAAALL